MSNIDVVWDDVACRGDWQVTPQGRLSTGNLLVTAVIISLFTDRRAPDSFVPPDRSNDRRGWWNDTFDGTQIGSLLWTLRRRKIADRNALIAEATNILNDALAWMVTTGVAARVSTTVSLPPAGLNGQGTLLGFTVKVFEPGGALPTVVRALWSKV